MAKNSLDRGVISLNDLKQFKIKLLYIILFTLLLVVSFITIFPLIWVILGSFKASAELFRIPPTFFPEEWVMDNFSEAWNRLRFPLYIRNTFIILFGTLLLSLLLSSLAGYALAKLKPWGGRKVFYMFLIALMVPPQVYMVPLYLTLRELPILQISLLNSYWALWLLGGINAFAILLFKGFFEGIATELLEAARVEGANEFRIFRSIIVPISTPVFAVISIFVMTGVWQDFLWPYIILADENKYPIMVALWRFGSSGITYNVYLAGLVISLIPPIILFLIFQRHIMQGLTLSGLKG